MSGIIFPDFAGSLAKAATFKNAHLQNQYAEEDRAAKAEIAPLIPKALQGDRAALDQIGSRHPDTAMKLAPLLERLDAATRTKAKEASEYTVQTGMAILNADPAQQPVLYARAREDAAARGMDTSKWPTQYDAGWLKFNVDKAMPFAEHFKRQTESQGPVMVPGASPPGGAPAPTGDPAAAISRIESGGKYDAVGPVANDKGNRAYGKYQVMDFNVGPWTQEVLGKPMTPQEFLANPQAQDAVFKAKFGQYQKQYGSGEAAARAWFAGPGGMNNPNAKDVLGTSVAGYAQKFNAGMGQGPQVAQGSDMPADASGNPLPPRQIPDDVMRQFTPILQPGHAFGVDPKTNKYIEQNGNLVVYDERTKRPVGLIPIPKPQEPRQQQAPAGYEFAPSGGLQPISGGPADPVTAKALATARRLDEQKPVPAPVARDIQTNLSNLKTVDKALAALEKNPGSVGGVGSNLASILPGVGNIQNRIDKEGTELRALVADIGSLIIHDRSGAAVTATEFPRLRPFIPTIADDPQTAKTKLAKFKATYEEVIKDMVDYYGPSNGYREYTPAAEYMKGQAPAAGPAAPAAPQQAAPSGITDGATATNPQTGEKIVFRNGQWAPLQ